MLKIICMHCKKIMGEKDGEGIEGISHSLCDDCNEKIAKKQLEELRLEMKKIKNN